MARAAAKPRTLGPTPTIDIAISMDMGTSMPSSIVDAAQDVLRRTYTEKNLRVAIIQHGGPDLTKPRVIEFGTDTSYLSLWNWYTNGDGRGKAYEQAINAATGLNWNPLAKQKHLIVIGDSMPHGVGYAYGGLVNTVDWRTEARKLADGGVILHGIQYRYYSTDVKRSAGFYKELATIGGGRMVTSNHSLDIALSTLLYNILVGKARPEVKPARKPRKPKAVVPKTKLLLVTSRGRIDEFVRDNGLYYSPGCGYYEFTKPETIQRHKKLIVQDKKTGALSFGAGARDLLDENSYVDTDDDVRLTPSSIKDFLAKYTLFIQSTADNRVLIPGTRFIYEYAE